MCVCVGGEGFGGGASVQFRDRTINNFANNRTRPIFCHLDLKAWPIKDLLYASMSKRVTGNPKWARWLHLDQVSSQSEHRIHFILQAMQ